MIFWILLVILVLAGFAFRHFVIGDIPEGYEDEEGFHYGRKTHE